VDFLTVHQSPIPITIDGKSYSLPRFLLPAFEKMAAKMLESQRKTAASEIAEPEKRAAFLMYYDPVPIDIAAVFQQVTTPTGAANIVRQQMQLAGVPDSDIDAVIENGDPMQIRALADRLANGVRGTVTVGADVEARKESPLVSPPGASDGSQGTGEPTTPDSPQPSPQ
jgi:hypothetical protein